MRNNDINAKSKSIYYASHGNNFAFCICIPDDAIFDIDIAVDYSIVVHDFAIFN